jgi:hypothetical protein
METRSLDFEVSKDVPQNVYGDSTRATDCLQSDIERVQVYRARIHQAKYRLVRRIHQWEYNFY